MNKGLLCSITGLTCFGLGFVTSRKLMVIALNQMAKESRERRERNKNDFSDYLNKTRFAKDEA